MNKIFTILVYLIFANITLADPNSPSGELLIKFLTGTPIGTFSVSVSSEDDYSWHWENNTVVLDNGFFSHTASGKTVYTFGSPKTNIGHGDYRISWGLFTFVITTNTGLSCTFQLDLRDEKWAEYYYPSHDTYILINDASNEFYISKSEVGGEKIDSGAFIELWEFWDLIPVQSNFKIPVTLKNRIEGGPSTDFGALWANNHQVPSGSVEGFKYDITNNIQHYTIETNYNNERKYSFKWITDNINLAGGQNYFFSNINFSIPVNYAAKDIIRNFRTVWPLTIKTNLGEAGGISFGNIYFKDPTTDNQFHSYPASGNGFEKNEAFEGLNENIPGYGYSKYSLKAFSSIPYIGRNYYWYSGDFNPTTQTDLLITGTTTKTAYYKGIGISDDENAYISNNQRKFVRTDDDWLHNVYCSMGRVWYETSSNNGVTWLLANNGQPLDNGLGKLPSIDYALKNTGGPLIYQIAIVFQEKAGGSSSKIKLKYFEKIDDNPSLNFISQKEIATVTGDYSAVITNPVIGFSPGSVATVIWKNGITGPLYGWHGSFGSVITTLAGPAQISGTTVNSINPTIYAKKTGTTLSFKLAWEELGDGNSSSIKYATLIGYLIISGSVTTPSSGSGFTQNYSPSIIQFMDASRLCWVGYRWISDPINEEDGFPQIKVLFKAPESTPSRFWQFGNFVSGPSINRKTGDDTYYAFAWYESSGQSKFADNTLSTIRTITDVSGQNLQISNGPSKENMFCMLFDHNAGVPYYFQMSDDLGSFYTMEKVTYYAFNSGREGIVSVDSAEFYFAIGDMKVDDQQINFKEIEDSIQISTLSVLNDYLITDPFDITDNSSFTYSIQYGINDSVSAVNSLTGNLYVNFVVKLIDENTGEILSEFDNITYNSENVYQYNNITYQVNTQGLGNRTVRLKLVVDNNFSSDYSLSKIFSDETVLGKKNFKEINIYGNGVISTYDLFQNYPNPFNPSTNIKYQLPKDGMITLRVYDILGAEVATLVNEEKAAGKYEVNFNASSLASGVYLYKLQVNEYISVKKMVLVR